MQTRFCKEYNYCTVYFFTTMRIHRQLPYMMWSCKHVYTEHTKKCYQTVRSWSTESDGVENQELPVIWQESVEPDFDQTVFRGKQQQLFSHEKISKKKIKGLLTPTVDTKCSICTVNCLQRKRKPNGKPTGAEEYAISWNAVFRLGQSQCSHEASLVAPPAHKNTQSLIKWREVERRSEYFVC